MTKLDKERKRGRKPLPPDIRRDIPLVFRVNAYEHEILKHYAELECLELGHYVREKTLKTKPPKRQLVIPEANQEYLKTFSALSNNLNQIARILNTDKTNADNIKIKSDINRLVQILLAMSSEMKTPTTDKE